MADDVERTARRILRSGGGAMILALVQQGDAFMPIAADVVDVAVAAVALLEWMRHQSTFKQQHEDIDRLLTALDVGRIRSVRTVNLGGPKD